MMEDRLIEAFLRSQGFDPQGDAVQCHVDQELSIYYPLLLTRVQDKTYISICQDIIEAKKTLMETTPDMRMRDVLSALFTDEVRRNIECVHVYGFCGTVEPFMPPAGYFVSPIENTSQLRLLADAMPYREWREGLPEENDEIIMAAYCDDTIVAACSLHKQGEMYDIAIATHPLYRQRGIATSLLTLTMRQEEGMFLYRCTQENKISQALCEKLGFKKCLSYYGAEISFPS